MMARRNKQGDYSYQRTARLRGRDDEGRFAVIQRGPDQTRVARRRPDGSAEGDGFLVPSVDVQDIRPTRIVPTGQRGTITLPDEFRRSLGIEEGTPLEIIEQEEVLSIRPLSRPGTSATAHDLDDLLGRITPENLHGESDTGGPIGGEVW
jgi:antitoxin MazE